MFVSYDGQNFTSTSIFFKLFKSLAENWLVFSTKYCPMSMGSLFYMLVKLFKIKSPVESPLPRKLLLCLLMITVTLYSQMIKYLVKFMVFFLFFFFWDGSLEAFERFGNFIKYMFLFYSSLFHVVRRFLNLSLSNSKWVILQKCWYFGFIFFFSLKFLAAILNFFWKYQCITRELRVYH